MDLIIISFIQMYRQASWLISTGYVCDMSVISLPMLPLVYRVSRDLRPKYSSRWFIKWTEACWTWRKCFVCFRSHSVFFSYFFSLDFFSAQELPIFVIERSGRFFRQIVRALNKLYLQWKKKSLSSVLFSTNVFFVFVSVSFPYHFRIILLSFSYRSPIVLLSFSYPEAENDMKRNDRWTDEVGWNKKSQSIKVYPKSVIRYW